MENQENPDSQTILNAVQSLHLEIKNLRTELNRLEGSILRERVKAVEQALSQNRLLLYADQMQDELGEDLEKITNPQCQNRLKCIEKFSALAGENLQMAQQANPQDTIADLDSKISQIRQTAQKAKGKPCEACYQNFEKKLKRQKRALQTIVLVEKTSDGQSGEQINVDRLVETVLEPLANPVRLKIFLGVYEGKKSFSKLSQASSLKGGNLLFHLKKLLDARLIVQEDNKGDYVITQKGADVIKKIFLFQ